MPAADSGFCRKVVRVVMRLLEKDWTVPQAETIPDSCPAASLPGLNEAARTLDDARMDGRSPETRKSVVANFFRSRWRGEARLELVFWRDMVLTGTAINVAATFIAVALLGIELPLASVLAVHFLPLPYNVFLFIAVWRSSGRAGGWAAHLAPLGAAAWLMLTVVI